MGRILLLITMLLWSVVSASASETSFDLLQRSLKTSSAIERGILRSQLASTYPETAEGMFAAAWIAGIEGRNDDKVRLYRAAIVADPELTVAYINLALELERTGQLDEARDLYDTALTTAPFDADLVRNGFFLRKDKMKRPDEAARFLDKWQETVGDLEYVFDFVRALDADMEGRYPEADRLYASAIAKDAPFEVYQRRASMRLHKMSDDKMPTGERLAFVSEVMQPLMNDEKSADAYLFVGRALRDMLNGGRYSIDYLGKAFDIEPTAEAADEAFTQMAIYDFAQARSFLEKAQTILPGNYGVQNSLGWMSYQFLAEPDRAAEFALAALEAAPHDQARMDAIVIFGASRQHYGRFGEAHQFFQERMAHPWSPQFRNRLLMLMTDNLIAAQRFDEARNYLEALRASDAADTGWLNYKSGLVEAAIGLESKRAASEPSPAAIWRAGFNAEAPPRVLFALNSDRIPAYAHDVLETSARLLKSQPAGKLILSIEGYTDQTGSDAGNVALSLRRAEAVRAYLIEHHGVRPEQLRLSAHGSRFPADSNLSYEGRIQNRRVEIQAIDTPDHPAAARPLVQRGSAFSSDGRYAVFGQNPPQLWDLRANAKLANFYRGRTHRFSPDGKYVSAISSFTEQGGQTTQVAYIYEAASGNAIAQLHEPHEIIDLVWKPDSTAVAFTTADGFLKVYDLEMRSYAGITRMSVVRIGGPLAWLPDGNTILGGQHRGREIVLWDAGTLSEIRRLDGVNWPHAVGASPDGRYLLAFDNRLRMTVWDMQKKARRQQMDVPMIPLDLQFHPQRPWVAFNARFEASDVSLAVVDFAKVARVSQWSDKGTYSIGLARGGSRLTAAAGDRFIDFDIPWLEPMNGQERGGNLEEGEGQ